MDRASPSFDENGIQFAWNSTSIKLSEECLRKYYYTMIEGWQSNGASVHLRFGGHYATALEHYYKHRALGMDNADALVEVVHEALRNTWEREYELIPEGFNILDPDYHVVSDDGEIFYRAKIGDGIPWVSDHPAKTRENLIRTIIWYVDQFENESIEVVHLSDGKPAVELSVVLPADDGILFTAHLDRVVDYSSNTYVMDQKTTGSTVTQHYFNGFAPDTQMSMYTFLGKAAFSIPVKGVIIDAAQIAVGFSRFERGFTFRTEGQLNEWYDDSMYHIEKARYATRERHWPMNRTACGNYGGCPFREVCSRDPSVRQNFLAAGFTKGKIFDPLEQR